ncbi:hypothetical protein D3C86_1847060 [compost metagenome]
MAVGDFSPRLQNEIDRIAEFATGVPKAHVVPARSDWPFSVPRAMHDCLSNSDKERLSVMVDSFIRAFAVEEKPRKKPPRAA